MAKERSAKKKKRHGGVGPLGCLYVLLGIAVLIFIILAVRFAIVFKGAYAEIREEIASRREAREMAEREESRRAEENRTSSEEPEPSGSETEPGEFSGENETENSSEESPGETESGPEDPASETEESVPPPSSSETPSAYEVSVDRPDSGLRIWIGDSRTVGLFMTVATDVRDVAIAEVGMSYPWFESTAVPILEQYIAGGNVSTVYINMGVNDCASSVKQPAQFAAPQYIQRINNLIAAHPGIRFVFVSVGPGDGASYNGTSIPALNQEVDRFNAAMYSSCAADFLDLCGFLKANGFSTQDGIHYTAATYRDIYSFVLGSS